MVRKESNENKSEVSNQITIDSKQPRDANKDGSDTKWSLDAPQQDALENLPRYLWLGKNGASPGKILKDTEEEELKPQASKSGMKTLKTAIEDPKRREHATTQPDEDPSDPDGDI